MEDITMIKATKIPAALFIFSFLHSTPLFAGETDQNTKSDARIDSTSLISNCADKYKGEDHTRDLELCKLNENRKCW